MTFGLFLLCLAALGGVFLIGSGHILVTAGLAIYLGRNLAIQKKARFRAGNASSPSAIFLWLFLTCCLVSILVHWSDYDDALRTLKKLRYILLILLVLAIPGGTLLLTSRLFRRIVLVGIAISVIVVCVPGIVSKFTGFNFLTGNPLRASGRIQGVSGTILTFAYTLQFFILVIGGILISGKDQRKWLDEAFPPGMIRTTIIVFLWILLWISFFLAESRGAMAGVIVGGMVLVSRLERRRLMWVSIPLGVMGVIFLSLFGSRILDYSDPIRPTIWRTATLSFLDHPTLGVGYRRLEVESDVLAEKYGVPPLRTTRRPVPYHFKGHAHNNYLEAFAGTGVLGGIAFAGFCGAWIYECSRRKDLQIFILPSAVAFAVSGLFESSFIDSEVVNVVMLLYLVSQLVPITAPRARRNSWRG